MTVLEMKQSGNALIILGLVDGYYVVKKEVNNINVWQSPPIRDSLKARRTYNEN